MAGKSPEGEGREEDRRRRAAAKPVLLSGGNPQIAKGDGDAPVQAYIAAMPGWKSEVGRRLDALIVAHRSRRAQGGEMELALLRRRGRGLVPQLPLLHQVHQGDLLPRRVAASVPPGESKQRMCATSTSTRTQFDEAQFAAWVKQASQLPGERM